MDRCHDFITSLMVPNYLNFESEYDETAKKINDLNNTIQTYSHKIKIDWSAEDYRLMCITTPQQKFKNINATLTKTKQSETVAKIV